MSRPSSSKVSIGHGEPVKTVKTRLGHAAAAETLDTYAHLWSDSDHRTRVAIDSVLGESDVPLSTTPADFPRTEEVIG